MRALPLVALAVLLAACDSGEPDPPRFGQFEAEMTGDLTRSLSGTAGFGRLFAGPGEDRTLTVTMLDRSVLLRSIGFSDDGGVLDREGTYDLGRDGPLGLLYQDGVESDAGTYVSTSGTLRITRFEDDRITGAFSADLASGFGGDGGSQVSVSGTFDAVPIRVPF